MRLRLNQPHPPVHHAAAPAAGDTAQGRVLVVCCAELDDSAEPLAHLDDADCVLQNAGGRVPGFADGRDDPGGAATIDYALACLDVSTVVLLGHAGCVFCQRHDDVEPTDEVTQQSLLAQRDRLERFLAAPPRTAMHVRIVTAWVDRAGSLHMWEPRLGRFRPAAPGEGIRMAHVMPALSEVVQ